MLEIESCSRKIKESVNNDFIIIGDRSKKDGNSQRDSSEQDLKELLQRYQSFTQLKPASPDDVSSHAMHFAIIDVICKLQNHEPFIFGEVY